MKISELRTRCRLFAGIEAGEFAPVLRCLAAVRRSCSDGAAIFRAGERKFSVGIVLSGAVRIVHEDFRGRRMILAQVPEGELFAEAFACAGIGSLSFDVVACGRTEVLLADYERIVTRCSNACAVHARIIANMACILAEKNVHLATKMQCLSLRSTRDRLLAFLSSRLDKGHDTVEIPFNRQELADYLSVDRSALSRELGLMQKEGLLRFHKNRFTLL